MDNMVGNTERVRGWTRAFANALSTGSGSEKLENASRYMAQAMGHTLVDIHGEAALKGDRTSEMFMEELAPVKWKQLMSTKAGKDKLAGRVAIAFQAAYNGQNLPSWALRGNLAPYARLMKWPIEQANNFRKFQIRPLVENGDPRPLAMYVATMLGGGLAVNELREKINNRKSYTPTWAELGAGKDKTRVNANIVAKLTKAGEAVGMFGSYMWLVNAAAQGLAGQQMPEVNNPGIGSVGSMATHALAAGNAILDGQDPLKVIPAAMDKVAQSQISAYRIARNWTVDEREKERRDLSRDYSVEQLLDGKKRRPYVPIVSYNALDEREFDEAKPRDARRIVGEALRNTPREKREEKQRTLKSMGGSNMGPREADWDKMQEYLRFVQKTQGTEAMNRARRALQRDEREREYKRELVP